MERRHGPEAATVSFEQGCADVNGGCLKRVLENLSRYRRARHPARIGRGVSEFEKIALSFSNSCSDEEARHILAARYFIWLTTISKRRADLIWLSEGLFQNF